MISSLTFPIIVLLITLFGALAGYIIITSENEKSEEK